MIPLADAQAALIAACPRLPAINRPVGQAAGYVCAEDVIATQTVPPFANSSLDGYAVRAADVQTAAEATPVQLRVVGTVAAGSIAATPVRAGQAWKVMTGAPLPEGADTVVMVEHSSATPEAPAAAAGDTVQIYAAPSPGVGIRAAGSNVSPGDIVVRAGTVLHPPHLGVLNSVGVSAVQVWARPRVGVLVTGDELVTTARPLAPGEIYESNRAMMLALLQHSNLDTVDLGVHGDTPGELEHQLTDALQQCDAIVTTGGVSMGDADPVKAALARLGRLNWLQVSIRPAKPFAYGLLDGPHRPVPVFGLPGNPVSSLVSFELLARPALLAMAGHTRLHRIQLIALADQALAAIGTDGRTTHLRVRAETGSDGRVHVRPVEGAQESHQLAATAHADGLAELPPGTRVEPGGSVLVRMLRWDP